jgi:hypothetical protein
VQRHVVTPVGFFDFFTDIHRVFGLMIACFDFSEADEMIDRLHNVVSLLQKTTTAGGEDERKFQECRRFYAHALTQVALQSSTVSGFPWARIRELKKLLRNVRELHDSVDMLGSNSQVRSVSRRLLFTDWGRRPYRDYWLRGGRKKQQNPRVLPSMLLGRVLSGIRQFRQAANLSIPYWPAVVFPTRPLSLGEITLAAPSLLSDAKKLRLAIFSFRGARMKDSDEIARNAGQGFDSPMEFVVPSPTLDSVTVAVPSILTTNEEWQAALDGKPLLNIDRYERIAAITNAMMSERPKPQYIAFPECSLPKGWAIAISHKLASRGISMLGGIEYERTSRGVRNDALVSLTTRWPWYSASINFLQPKFEPSHGERYALSKSRRSALYRPRGEELKLPIYVHGGFCFGALICSDLTNISYRSKFQGEVDALFVLEWNPDVDSFGSLIEAAAQDLHGYIIQVNNRQFGDSRVRVPRRLEYERDAVRVKGGLSNYFVTARLDIQNLRQAQMNGQGSSKGEFKPTPIGYAISMRRKGLA